MTCRSLLPVTILGFAIPCSSWADEGATDLITLRVLCYNIQHGRGMDQKIDLERIARVIKDAKPDLVALQEVDRNTSRSGQVDQTATLGKLTGMNSHFGKAIPFQGGEYGQAVLSRFPISEPKVHRLPGKPDQEQRIVLEVTATVADQPLRFLSTHFQHDDGPTRERQAATVNQLFGNDTVPTILAGDLNAVPNSEPLKIIGSVWQHAIEKEPAPSHPSTNPRKRIDYILWRPMGVFRVKEVKVIPEEMASDHRPVLAVFEWTPK